MPASTALGELNQRVAIKRKNLTRNSVTGGATAATPSTLATVWAKVEPLRGREKMAAQREEATSDFLITIRNRDDLKEEDYFEWSGRKLNITFIRRKGLREPFLEIEATMGAAA